MLTGHNNQFSTKLDNTRCTALGQKNTLLNTVCRHDVWVLNARLLLNPKNVPLVTVDTTLAGYEVKLSEAAMDVAYRASAPLQPSLLRGQSGGGQPPLNGDSASAGAALSAIDDVVLKNARPGGCGQLLSYTQPSLLAAAE